MVQRPVRPCLPVAQSVPSGESGTHSARLRACVRPPSARPLHLFVMSLTLSVLHRPCVRPSPTHHRHLSTEKERPADETLPVRVASRGLDTSPRRHAQLPPRFPRLVSWKPPSICDNKRCVSVNLRVPSPGCDRRLPCALPGPRGRESGPCGFCSEHPSVRVHKIQCCYCACSVWHYFLRR